MSESNGTAPEQTAAPFDAARQQAAALASLPRKPLRGPQVRILRCLADATAPLSRAEIIAQTGVDTAYCVSWIGGNDPVRRAYNDLAYFPSLVSLGYVEGFPPGKPAVAYAITEAGRAALSALLVAAVADADRLAAVAVAKAAVAQQREASKASRLVAQQEAAARKQAAATERAGKLAAAQAVAAEKAAGKLLALQAKLVALQSKLAPPSAPEGDERKAEADYAVVQECAARLPAPTAPSGDGPPVEGLRSLLAVA